MLNDTIRKALSLRPSRINQNACGIEVEAEGGTELPEGMEYWSAHQDGSLVNGIELVSKPLNLLDIGENSSIEKELEEFFKLNDITFSERASTHVHFNCRERTVLEVLNIITGYYLIENVLLYYVGEDRRANHFCLALSDSMRLIDYIVGKIYDGAIPFPDNTFKYSSLNVGRLWDLGTIELRIMGSMTDAKEIIQWGRDVSTMFNTLSNSDTDPTSVINSFVRDPISFIRGVIPVHILRKVLENKGLTEVEELKDLCMKAIPPLVPLAILDWDSLKKTLGTKKNLRVSNRDYELPEDEEARDMVEEQEFDLVDDNEV